MESSELTMKVKCLAAIVWYVCLRQKHAAAAVGLTDPRTSSAMLTYLWPHLIHDISAHAPADIRPEETSPNRMFYVSLLS
nr:hypothetical protein CFP56_71873 [Quercus suber]